MGSESHDFTPNPAADSALDGPQAGPSWQRSHWPLAGGASEDDLTQALDPLMLKAAIKTALNKVDAAKPAIDEAALEAAASDTIRA
ncbi:MAG: hypothetical protein RLY97_343, partial [Pseudomonadota bacterium]